MSKKPTPMALRLNALEMHKQDRPIEKGENKEEAHSRFRQSQKHARTERKSREKTKVDIIEEMP